MPLACGGGIKALEQIYELLAIGYEKVFLNTVLVENPELITKAAEAFGSQIIIASIYAKKIDGKYKCYICDGTEVVDRTPVEMAEKVEHLGTGEIIINSVDRDGMMQGYGTEFVKSVVEVVKVSVVAIGDASGIKDLKDVIEN